LTFDPLIFLPKKNNYLEIKTKERPQNGIAQLIFLNNPKVVPGILEKQ